MAQVRALAYAIVSATDLQAWETFAVELLGLQIAEKSEERLLLRMDEKSYRLDIRKGETDGVTTVGWEVGGPAELETLASRLESSGYAVKRWGQADARATRRVSGLISFNDPDGLETELVYGFNADKDPFVSPTGARFVTGVGGMGHVFQLVEDEDAYSRLYFDLLGFKLSDHIDFGPLQGIFTHCNERHHSFAFAVIPNAPKGIGHLMIEVDDIDVVGRAYDRVLAGAAPLELTFGRHSNDKMQSFYVRTPSGFSIEYGFGGVVIDDATWLPDRYAAPSLWGHERQDPNAIDV